MKETYSLDGATTAFLISFRNRKILKIVSPKKLDFKNELKETPITLISFNMYI